MFSQIDACKSQDKMRNLLPKLFSIQGAVQNCGHGPTIAVIKNTELLKAIFSRIVEQFNIMILRAAMSVYCQWWHVASVDSQYLMLSHENEGAKKP